MNPQNAAGWAAIVENDVEAGWHRNKGDTIHIYQYYTFYLYNTSVISRGIGQGIDTRGWPSATHGKEGSGHCRSDRGGGRVGVNGASPGGSHASSCHVDLLVSPKTGFPTPVYRRNLYKRIWAWYIETNSARSRRDGGDDDIPKHRRRRRAVRLSVTTRGEVLSGAVPSTSSWGSVPR